jgi:adenine phosphoribosyltransferase
MNDTNILQQIKNEIRDVPDFPLPGILFRDISGLLKSPLFREAVRLMGQKVQIPEYWAGIESRGFIFASALAMHYGGGVVLCRKKNKLPPPVVSVDYSLEYGMDRIEAGPGTGKVVLVDDVLATGGTMLAADRLLKEAGYSLQDKLVLINLKYLNSIQDVKSLIDYE